jgi:hypothetical protein
MPPSLLQQRSDMKRTALQAAREGRSTPHPRNQAQLLMIAGDWAAEQLEQWGVPSPSTAIDRCAAYLQERANHTTEKTCPVCGKPVDNPRATYCSSTCKQRAHRERRLSPEQSDGRSTSTTRSGFIGRRAQPQRRTPNDF